MKLVGFLAVLLLLGAGILLVLPQPIETKAAPVTAVSAAAAEPNFEGIFPADG